MAHGHRRAEGALARADPLRRGDLVPGLLRARVGLRPRLAEDEGGQGRRRLARHRAEGLDDVRARGEVVHARRPHRHRRPPSTRASPTSSATWSRRASRSGRWSRSPARPSSTRSSSTTPTVPDENVVGGVGNGWMVAITTLMNERAGLGGGAAVALTRDLGAADHADQGARPRRRPDDPPAGRQAADRDRGAPARRDARR